MPGRFEEFSSSDRDGQVVQLASISAGDHDTFIFQIQLASQTRQKV
jgi:hypothetical protein